MDMILHAADVSNPFKPFEIFSNWAKFVLEEFWAQGDLER
jgi:cAMP-specific phosphodiesterase 4